MTKSIKYYMLVVITVLFAAYANGIAETATIAPDTCVIVIPTEVDATKGKALVQREANLYNEAANELQKHMKLVTGVKIEIITGEKAPAGKYPFYIGTTFPGDTKPLSPEEARWAITKDGTYLYGNDKNGRGTLFSIYCFLEEQLGIRWIEPGDKGIAYKKQTPLVLTEGQFSWAPVLLKRHIRIRDRVLQDVKIPGLKGDIVLFDGFRRTLEENNQDAIDGKMWQQRMRMGGHDTPQYGHAFTKWWMKYGKEHPEYFAMRPDGKRMPMETAVRADKPLYTKENPRTWQEIKMCCSNPGLPKQIVQDWLDRGKRGKYIAVCENDTPGGPFCTCEGCRKLDVPANGDMKELADRYVYLANAVAREARKHDPNARAVMYAYDRSEWPPLKQKLEPNVTVAIVPTTFDIPRMEKLFGGWKNAGATEIIIRPNLHWYWMMTTLPMGFEKQWYDLVQLVVKNGGVGFDFDSIKRNWPTTGLSNYILAKSMSDPTKPFEYWVNQYMSAYGPAAEDVKKYYAYWRNEVWEKRICPDIPKVLPNQDGNFCRAMLKRDLVKKYYKTADFDATDAILKTASSKNLSAPEREKLNQLTAANEQARLLFNAITTPMPEKLKHAKKLLDYRKKLGNNHGVTWIDFIAMELSYADNGIAKAITLTDDGINNFCQYEQPWIDTGLVWKFQLDPKNFGLKGNWNNYSWQQMSNWQNLRTDSYWDRPYDSETNPVLYKLLLDYDGVGWYGTKIATPYQFKDREIYLYFDGIGNSCHLFVNGKFAGAFPKDESGKFDTSGTTVEAFGAKPAEGELWMGTLAIRIDNLINWNEPSQTLLVRVSNPQGHGGIYKKVWIVSKKAAKESPKK